MELVQIRITVLAITARYGSLPEGQSLDTDAAYAKHLVEEARCAEYVRAVPAATAGTGGVAREAGGSAGVSKAMTVPQIREMLAAKNIEIPEGVTIKAELLALLDEQQ